MIKDFDLTTKDGIQQAKRYIAKQRRDAAINEFHAAFDTAMFYYIHKFRGITIF